MNGKRPCKSNRPKERAKMLDDFDHCVIKRAIHGLYSRKIAPTVSLIHKEIKDSIKISKSKLHTQSFRCLLIYPTKWDNWLLRCLFLTKQGKQLILQTFGNPEISHIFTQPILQKMQNITIIYERNIMLLIVFAEAALRRFFLFWSYFVVIFRVGVDVLYRRAIRTSGI
jgi:hypothetical protein